METERISEIEYQTYSEELRKELEKNREEQRNARKNGNYSGIPKNMSREAFDRTSPAVCRNLYQGYSEDIYSKLDIAHHLIHFATSDKNLSICFWSMFRW